MREGILPSEGVDAFDRIIASGISVQVIASSVDVDAWTAKVDADAQASDDDVDRRAVRSTSDRTSARDFEPPATPLERELAAMWRAVLGIERVGRHDDFFELGGHSLIAVRLFTNMKKRYAIDLPLSTLFEAPDDRPVGRDRGRQARDRRRDRRRRARRRRDPGRRRGAAGGILGRVGLPLARDDPARQRTADPVLLRPRVGRQRVELPRPVAGDGTEPAVLRRAVPRRRRSVPAPRLDRGDGDRVPRRDPGVAARGPVHARRLLRGRPGRVRDGAPD